METNDIQPSEAHLKCLEKNFGHVKFRPLQWQIINSVMEEKRDACVVMATGYGKSLCFQYPPVYSNQLAIVISPLISLMEDQVKSLEVSNIPSCFLGTAQQKKTEAFENLLKGVYRLVYMSPEFATSDTGLEFLPKLIKSVKVVLLAIDEAHCVSKWGHDFRPAYRGLMKIRYVLPNVPILALTATATNKVKEDIIKSLGLRKPVMLSSSFDRPNLFFKVEKKSGDVYEDISKVLFKENKKFQINSGSTIIYCLTKKMTEEIAELLQSKNISCEHYHAGLNMRLRKEVYEKFVNDEIRVIVATIAFGMGIDKPNVRCVIHFGVPSEMEGYYQEAGRAGRDGNPSLCVLFFSPADFVTHTYLQSKSYGRGNTDRDGCGAYMKQYTSSRDCRRHLIISYFDPTFICPKDTLNCCDNCNLMLTSPDDSVKYEGIDANGCYDFAEDAAKFLTAIDCFRPKKFGLNKIIALLRGSKAKTIDPKYFIHEIHGAGIRKSEEWWKQIALLLEQDRFICKETVISQKMTYQVINIDGKGDKWFRERKFNKNTPLLQKPTKDMMKFFKVKSITPLASGDWNSKIDLDEFSFKKLISTDLLQTDNTLNEDDEKLFLELKMLRHSVAKSQNVIPHTIFSDTALEQFAVKKPVNIQMLSQGKFDGVSETKINKFGKIFVDFLAQKNATKFVSSLLKTKIVLSETQEKSYRLFASGISIENIALQRTLAVSTIVNHICNAIKSGMDINMARLISAQKLKCILDVINGDVIKQDVSKLQPIKNLCPQIITFDDVKFAIAYFEFREHIKTLGISYKDNYTISTTGDKIEYTSNETKTVIEDKECDSDKTDIEDDECDFTNKVDGTVWEEDDFLLDNIDQIQRAESFTIESVDTNIIKPCEKIDDKPQIIKPKTLNEIQFQKCEQPKPGVSKLCEEFSLNKRKNIFLNDSDSDDNIEQCNYSKKQDVHTTRTIMKKKMSKNSIFN